MRRRHLDRVTHSPAAHEAITAELVRLTLGGKPERLELVDRDPYGTADLAGRTVPRAWLVDAAGLEPAAFAL